MSINYLLSVLLFFAYMQVEAQKVFQFGHGLRLNGTGNEAQTPFAGGINAAQIQQMDVNGNGQDELVVWDKNAGNILVFEKTTGKYLHNPILSYYFPEDVNGFFILEDFNGDGKKDLFTSSPFGIKVYENITETSRTIPKWEVAQNFLKLDNGSNLQVNPMDIPAIIDLDKDGDLDIISFHFASGDYLEYYQNTSVERKGSADLDGFAPGIAWWGGFQFCGCDNFSFDSTCSGRPLLKTSPEEINLRVNHAGGHSLLLHDFNDDGSLDILMGQDECNRLFYLPNDGSNRSPDFNSFSTDLPGMGPLPEFPVFHVANVLEGDLVITTNSSYAAVEYNLDYARSLYHYQEGDSLTSTAFLQETMVDLGENSRPFFKGNSSSGELIVTVNCLVDNKTVGKAYQWDLSPEGLILKDEDYLNLSSLKWTDLQVQEFMSADNSSLLMVSGVEIINSTPQRKLLLSPSLDERGFQEVQVPGVQLRGADHLELFRHSGEDFMLLARQSGELIRYKVNFGEIISLELMDRDFLGFSDNPAHRNLSAHVVYPSSNQLDLFVVDQNGKLAHIPDFLGSGTPNTKLLQLEQNQITETRLGRNTWISSIPSIFGDKTDLLLGSTAGGLIFLEDISNGNIPPDNEALRIKLYPNPSHGPVQVISSMAGRINLFNTLGQVLIRNMAIQENIPLEIDTRYLSNGVYFVHYISNTGRKITKKLILAKT